MELDELVLRLLDVEKSLQLFKRLNFLIVVLINKRQYKRRFEVVLLDSLSDKIVFVECAVEEEPGVVDELQLLLYLPQASIQPLIRLLVVFGEVAEHRPPEFTVHGYLAI